MVTKAEPPRLEQSEQLRQPHTTQLAAVNTNEQKNILAIRIYDKIKMKYRPIATKLTGMLQELDNSIMLELLDSDTKFWTKVQGAIEILAVANYDDFLNKSRQDDAIHTSITSLQDDVFIENKRSKFKSPPHRQLMSLEAGEIRECLEMITHTMNTSPSEDDLRQCLRSVQKLLESHLDIERQQAPQESHVNPHEARQTQQWSSEMEIGSRKSAQESSEMPNRVHHNHHSGPDVRDSSPSSHHKTQDIRPYETDRIKQQPVHETDTIRQQHEHETDNIRPASLDSSDDGLHENHEESEDDGREVSTAEEDRFFLNQSSQETLHSSPHDLLRESRQQSHDAGVGEAHSCETHNTIQGHPINQMPHDVSRELRQHVSAVEAHSGETHTIQGLPRNQMPNDVLQELSQQPHHINVGENCERQNNLPGNQEHPVTPHDVLPRGDYPPQTRIFLTFPPGNQIHQERRLREDYPLEDHVNDNNHHRFSGNHNLSVIPADIGVRGYYPQQYIPPFLPEIQRYHATPYGTLSYSDYGIIQESRRLPSSLPPYPVRSLTNPQPETQIVTHLPQYIEPPYARSPTTSQAQIKKRFLSMFPSEPLHIKHPKSIPPGFPALYLQNPLVSLNAQDSSVILPTRSDEENINDVTKTQNVSTHANENMNELKNDSKDVQTPDRVHDEDNTSMEYSKPETHTLQELAEWPSDENYLKFIKMAARGMLYMKSLEFQKERELPQDLPQDLPNVNKSLKWSELASANPEDRRQMLGGRLLPSVEKEETGNQAGKITGMLLELDNGEILELLDDNDKLKEKVVEAVTVLKDYKKGKLAEKLSEQEENVPQAEKLLKAIEVALVDETVTVLQEDTEHEEDEPFVQHEQPTNVIPVYKPLTASNLASVSPQDQRRILGEHLYPLIAKEETGNQASKITGMFLELVNEDILQLLDDHDKLKEKIQEAVAVLEDFNKRKQIRIEEKQKDIENRANDDSKTNETTVTEASNADINAKSVAEDQAQTSGETTAKILKNKKKRSRITKI